MVSHTEEGCLILGFLSFKVTSVAATSLQVHATVSLEQWHIAMQI